MEFDIDLVWSSCIEFMRDNLSSIEDKETSRGLNDSFDLLFSKVKPVSLVGKDMTLQVPSNFYREYIEDNYLSLLSSALRKNIGKGVKLWYCIADRTSGESSGTQQKGKSIQTPRTQEIVNSTIKVSDKINPFPFVPKTRNINIDSQLNPVLTFDNFIEGESNKFASTVAKTIAKRPGATSFNPLFIHGDVGVGKTHLAQAVGLEVKNLYPEKVVLYVSSEKFIQQFVSAAKSHNKTDFANFYQMIDVWIIDDVQFLSSKTATQEMFFHIFDHLHQNGKQIVLTSDKAPAEIQEIQERIVSRFKWGLSAEIKSPDYDTRKKIIIGKLQQDGIELSEEYIDYLASETKSSVRELIGIINSVIAHSMINRSELSMELLRETIEKISSSRKKQIDIEYVQNIVCDHFSIKKEQLLSKTKRREITLPRQIAMYFAKEYTDESFSKIGKKMGGKNYTTVMHACQTISGIAEVDREVNQLVKEIRHKIIR